MTSTPVPFARLREVLSDLGFRQVSLPGDGIAFEHDRSDAFLVMPKYRSNQAVAPHHLIMCRVQLDSRGILDADEFDRRLASEAMRHPA